MIQAYVKMWKNAFNFSGRTSRSDYWWAVLCNLIVAFGVGLVAGIIGVIPALISEDLAGIGSAIQNIITYGWSLVVLIPGMSMAIRRLHDIGKSGWMYLVCCLTSACCGIGSIILIVFMCMDSQPGPNQWGPNPNEMNMGGYNPQMNAYGQNPQMGGYGQPNQMGGYSQNPQMNNMNGYNQNNGFDQNNNNQF